MVGAAVDEKFVDLYMERRTRTTIEFPDHLDRPNASLPPCSEYTAAKELHNLAAQIRKLSDMPRALGEADRALRFCPFRSPLVVKRMPDPQALMGPPKRPLHAEHLVELLGEWTDPDGKVHLAPVDAIDPSGQLRLTVAILYDQARRRESVTMLRRRNIALTETEVRAMLERINGPIRPEWAPLFVNALMEWEAEEDKQGFHRVYPISTLIKAELDLFENRAGWMERDPNDWLFRSPTDPKLSLPWHTLYNTPEPRKAEEARSISMPRGRSRLQRAARSATMQTARSATSVRAAGISARWPCCAIGSALRVATRTGSSPCTRGRSPTAGATVGLFA